MNTELIKEMLNIFYICLEYLLLMYFNENYGITRAFLYTLITKNIIKITYDACIYFMYINERKEFYEF